MNNEKREELLIKLKDEYAELCGRVERLHTFINEARLIGSKSYNDVKKMLPKNHYSYMDDINEQFKAMQKYAYYLSYRISYLQEEIDWEGKEKNNVTATID